MKFKRKATMNNSPQLDRTVDKDGDGTRDYLIPPMKLANKLAKAINVEPATLGYYEFNMDVGARDFIPSVSRLCGALRLTLTGLRTQHCH